jgi:hypothetical protein
MSILFRACVLSAATCLVACGGGSDNPNPKPSSSSSSVNVSSLLSSSVLSSTLAVSSSSAPATVSSESTSNSSESIASSSSQNSSMVSVMTKIDGTVSAFDEIGNSVELDSELLDIQVNLLDSNNQSLQSVKPIAGSYGSEKSVRFNADLSGTDPGSVTITVSYPGYTSYSRKLEAKSAIQFDAKLQWVPVQTVGISEATSISGAAVEGFTINVSAADDEMQRDSMQIQIPGSLLPEGTESLDVAVRTFDPNDGDDKQFFPGAYADSDGNQLASVAFNFAEINTATGEPVLQAMRKARQAKIAKAGGAYKTAADEPVIINRQIPVASCGLLETLGDSDSLGVGFQIPVYTYNPVTGVWDLLGQGTIYNEQGELVSESQQEFDCESVKFYLEILVTNEIFLSDWWNLDYPLTFSQPVDYCARVKLQNPEGESLAGVSGIVSDENGAMDFASGYFTTDAQGVADVKVAQSGVESQATLYFYEMGEFGFVKKAITLSSNCASPDIQVIELERLSMCSISGSLSFKNGQPVEREMVYALSDTNSLVFGVDYINSDKQGNYRLSLPCKGMYQVAPVSRLWGDLDNDPWARVSTDGAAQADELSDDGQSVVMKPIQLDYMKPLVQSYYVDETNDLWLHFFSNYSAFPMSYTATITSEDGQTNYGTLTGTVSADTVDNEENAFFFFNIGEVQLKHDLPVQADSSLFLLKLDITDAFNNKWPDIQTAIIIQDVDGSISRQLTH